MSKVADLDNGVAVYQATDEPEVKDNIYCERSYCSPDSEVFIYQRKVGDDAPVWKHESELVACHFGTGKNRFSAEGIRIRRSAERGVSSTAGRRRMESVN